LAYQIIWSEPALRDLERVYAFIADDSERYALAQVRKLLTSVRRLEQFPLSGKVVANLGRDDVREIVVPPYVLMYQVNQRLQRVEVMLVIHGSRDRT
jgi:toxin ParE1/3/4